MTMDTPPTPTKKIVYRLEVRVTQPLTDDPENVDFYTEAVATSTERRRELERTLFNWLKRFDGDCDVELMDFSVEDE